MDAELKQLRQDFLCLQKQTEEVVVMLSASVSNLVKMHQHYSLIRNRVQEAVRRLDLEIMYSQMQQYFGDNDRGDYEDGYCVTKK